MRTQPANQSPIADVQPLMPDQVSTELTPESDVVILFKGGPPVIDKYDSKDYVIPPLPRGPDRSPLATLEQWKGVRHQPAYFRVKYGVALHLQSRAIVPGTRNPHNGKAHSSLAIVETPNGKGLDPAHRAVPFTDEQLAQWGHATEGLDRSMFEDSRRTVQTMPTEVGLQAAYARGLDPEASIEAAHDKAATAPGVDPELLRDVHVAEHEAQASDVRVSETRPSKTRFKDDPRR